MGVVRVRVLDVSGSRSREVEAPDDVPIERILVLLVEKMNLPLNSPDGQIITYKLHHRSTGRQLFDHETLADVRAMDGEEFRLQPEITAGWEVIVAFRSVKVAPFRPSEPYKVAAFAERKATIVDSLVLRPERSR